MEQAEFSFDDYVAATLSASQRFGGRFNPPSEFGAIYTAQELDTAWIEVAHRFAAEGIDGLPPEMGVLRLLIRSASYADVRDEDGCTLWDIHFDSLIAPDPLSHQQEECYRLARHVRAVGDALLTRSARTRGSNMPLFPDRQDSTLELRFYEGRRERPPENLLQHSVEEW